MAKSKKPGWRTKIGVTAAFAGSSIFSGCDNRPQLSREQAIAVKQIEDSVARRVEENLKHGISSSDTLINSIRFGIATAFHGYYDGGGIPMPSGQRKESGAELKDRFFNFLDGIQRVLERQPELERKKVINALAQWEAELSPSEWCPEHNGVLAKILGGSSEPEVERQRQRIEHDPAYRSAARSFIGDAVHIALLQICQQKGR